MEETISFPKKSEHRINAENVTLTMLADSERIEAARPHAFTDLIHTHAHAELFACTESVIHLQLKSGFVVLHAGDIAIVPPGLLHYMLAPEGDGTKWHTIDFLCVAHRRTGCIDLMQHLSRFFRSDRLLVARNVPHLAEQAKAIHIGNRESSCLPAVHLLALLCSLAELPLQEIEENSQEPAPLPTVLTEKNKDIDRLARLYDLVNCYFFDELTLERAASLLYISTRQLERITKQQYGKPFKQLLCERRIASAEKMLAETALPIEQIASSVGFPSRAAFCRAFVKAHGTAPTEYRKALKSRAEAP